MGGPGKGICGTLLFAPWVVWQILNMSWFMFQIQSTHPQQKKNLPSRPSTAVLQRARLITHECEEYFEQVRLHDIKDSTFAINRTRPNDEKTEILLGCVQYVFVIEPLLNMYFFPVTMRPWTALSWCPPAPRSNRSCLGTSKTVRKSNSDQFVKKKLIKYVDNWTNFGIKSYEFGLQNIIG